MGKSEFCLQIILAKESFLQVFYLEKHNFQKNHKIAIVNHFSD